MIGRDRLRRGVAILALATLGACAPPARADGPIRAAVVTGGHDHDASFYSIFGGIAGLDALPVLTSAEAFRADIRGKYDVVILYDFTRDLPDPAKQNLRNYVEAGGGVVVLHHALLDFNDWGWWTDDAVGGSYRLSSPSSGVANDVTFDVAPAADHPVVAGVGPFRVRDEAYSRMRMNPKIRPLLTTDQPASDRVVAWLGPDERFRVVAIQLGHGRSIFAHPAYRTLIRNAILWSAGRPVVLAKDLVKPKGPDRPRRLLVVGQAKGYQHETTSTAMVTLHDLGRDRGGWETTFRTDCTAVTKKPLKYEAKNLDDFDAVAFFTDGDLDMDASQKADLLSFVRDDGKGFLGIHSAAITFTGWPEYGAMLGGSFDGHPWGTFDAPLVVEDPAFPGLGHLPGAFTLRDEVYQIKDFSRDRVRVLLRLDASKVDLARPGVRRRDGDFAVAWARAFGKGRVAYNGLGHSADAWARPELRAMWREMVRWTLGDVPGDATPRPAPAK